MTGGWLTAETGTYCYMAPEVICHERYSKSADVFSYGCLLFELVTRQCPFADRPALQAAVAVGLNRTRPTLPKETPLVLQTLIQSCWQHSAAARPSFASVHGEVTALPGNLSEAERRWIDEPHGHRVYSARETSERAGGSEEAEAAD